MKQATLEDTILVTGCAGFIGSNFVHAWLENHDTSVVNIDKLTYAGNLANLNAVKNDSRHVFMRGDIGDSEMIDRVLTEFRPRAVLNFAAESHVDRSIRGPAEFIETNVVGTFRLLESVRNFWGALRGDHAERFRFLHVSTDEVYGSLAPDEPAFSESNNYRPNSPYSASKAASDHFVHAWHQTFGVPVLITNCSNNYGPYQFPEKLIPLIILNALGGKPLPIYGDGQQIRDWLYVHDHCDAIMRVLDAGVPGETYNIGGKSEKANLDVVRDICHVLDEVRPNQSGASYVDQIEFVDDRPGHDRRYAIDTRKIEHELNWRPRESFETGLRKTIDWYLGNDQWVSGVLSGEYQRWVASHYGA